MAERHTWTRDGRIFRALGHLVRQKDVRKCVFPLVIELLRIESCDLACLPHRVWDDAFLYSLRLKGLLIGAPVF